MKFRFYEMCYKREDWEEGGQNAPPPPNQQVESIHFLSVPRLSAATHLDFLLLCWQFTKKNRAVQQHHEIRNT